MIADTAANRKSLTTAISTAFRKLRITTKGEHFGERVFGVVRIAPDEIELLYEAAGLSNEEHYYIRVDSVGLGGTSVRGGHHGMVSEIEDLARETKREWERTRRA